jgi:C1A family cysteine protease
MPRAQRRKSPRPRAQRGFGWVPDLPDQRDVLYGAVQPLAARLPPSVDLRLGCSPIEDQGALGSCTGNAIAGALEFLERKDRVRFVNVSRLFIYYNERVIEHTIKSDSGAMIRDGIKSVVKQGVCSERQWPYVIAKYAVKPRATCYKEALQHQVTSYQRILTVDEMRACLAQGFPFVFGFTVYESFQSRLVAESGIVSLPEPGERVVGGHAVLSVGYDDADRRFIVRNSWGVGWGMHGYFTMPYAYLANRNLADDMWTIRRGEAM